MAPDFTAIANQAEADLNTYRSKTDAARSQGLNKAGVNYMAEKKFEGRGAQVNYGDELSTSTTFNKRIPPSEGGVLDDRGGSLDKLNQPSKHTATNDNDVVPARVHPVSDRGGQDDIATNGQKAQISNVDLEAVSTRASSATQKRSGPQLGAGLHPAGERGGG